MFFDTLGIAWEYEKEGYELPSGKYLPDFWLPKEGVWAEVKGGAFKADEIQKCRELVEATESPCLMLDGPPQGRTYWAFELWEDGLVQTIDYDPCSFRHYDRFFVMSCATNYPETSPSVYAGGCPGLAAANSARFEFGQTPKKPSKPKAEAAPKKEKTDHQLGVYQTGDGTWQIQMSSQSGDSWGWWDGPFRTEAEATNKAIEIAEIEGVNFYV